MDFRAALEYAGDDPDASRQVTVGTLVTVLPVVSFAAIGFEVQTARNVAAGLERPLPGWGRPLELFRLGLWLALARWVYGLPGIVLALGPLLAALALLARRFGGWQVRVPLAHLVPVALAGALIGAVLGGLYALLYTFAAPAITAQYVRTGKLTACFDVPALAGLVRHGGRDYWRVRLGDAGLSLALGLALGAAGTLLVAVPCLGPLTALLLGAGATFVQRLWDAHWVGQLLRESDLSGTGPG